MKHEIKFRFGLLYFIPLFFLGSCGGGGSSDIFAPVTFEVEPVVPNASFPVSLAQAPDGRLFYTELSTGNIRVVVDGALNPNPDKPEKFC